MKALNVVFWGAVAGVVISLGGGIYTAVQQKRAESQPAPISIPLPAMPSQ